MSKSLFEKIKPYILIASFLLSVVFSIMLLPALSMKKQAQSKGKKSKSIIRGKDGVAIVRFEGILTLQADSRGLFNDRRKSSAEKLIEDFEYYLKRDDVKAVVFSINSPGGTSAAAEEVYNRIYDLRKKYKKPIVASFRELAASGGYYIAMLADKIVSNPGAITGSIGVIMRTMNFDGAMKKLGIEYYAFTSGKNKDMLSSYRKLRADEKEYMDQMVQGIHERFKKVVLNSREEKIEAPHAEIFDGRIYSGIQAQKAGLVDVLGGEHEAVLLAAKMADLVDREDPHIIEDESADPYENFIKMFSSIMDETFFSKNYISDILSKQYTGVPMYLYLGRSIK